VNLENLGVALLVVLFLLISLAMVLVVLIQRPQGGGLSGAFGAGGGSGQSAFGARTGDALTISTIVIFVLFLGIAIGLNFALRPTEEIPTVAQPAGGAPAQTTEDGGAGAAGDDAPLPPPAEQPAPQNEDGNEDGNQPETTPTTNEPAPTENGGE